MQFAPSGLHCTLALSLPRRRREAHDLAIAQPRAGFVSESFADTTAHKRALAVRAPRVVGQK
jgi:hypothetical protein